MKHFLIKVSLLFILYIPVLFKTIESISAQKPYTDSLKIYLISFKKQTNDSILKDAISKAQATVILNDALLIKLLRIDSLASSIKISQATMLSYANIVAHLAKQLHPDGNNIIYATSLKNVGDHYGRMSQSWKALTFYEQSEAILKNILAETNLGYMRALDCLAYSYFETGQYAKSEMFYSKEIELLRSLPNRSDSQYNRALDGLAEVLMNAGKYEKALPIIKERFTLVKNIYGENNMYYASCLRVLALTYDHMGKYDEALSLCKKVLDIAEKLNGNDRTKYTTLLNNVAFVYAERGQYTEALAIYNECCNILKNACGTNNQGYGGSLIDLGYTYCKLGRYKEAMPMFEQALSIIQKTCGYEHPWDALILDGLALIYKHIGDYDKALSFCWQGLEIRKKSLGEQHPYYARSLQNLAAIYVALGQYDKAKPLYQQALLATKSALGEDHPDYAKCLNELALNHEREKEYDTANYLFEKAVAITKKELGTEHPVYARYLSNLATLFVATKQYDTALALYQTSQAIIKKVLGEAHPDYAANLNNMAILYNNMGEQKAIPPLLIQASNINLKHIHQTYAALSENEKITFIDNNLPGFSLLPSLLFTQGANQPEIVNQLYTNELTLKGMALQDQKNVLNSIRASKDSVVIKLYEQWHKNKILVGRQQLLQIAERLPNLDSLDGATNQLEQQLSQRSATFNQQFNGSNVTAKDIAKGISKGEAVVEFVRFPLFNNGWTDSIIYGAIILLHGDTVPQFITLCEEKQLLKLLKPAAGFADDEEMVTQLFGDGNDGGTNGNALYKLIWKPFEKYLTNINTVFYAPTGLLHRVAFGAIRCDRNNYLIDRFQLNQVLSTRYALSAVSATPLTACMWGNIKYGNISDESKSFAVKQLNKTQNLFDPKNATGDFCHVDTRGARNEGWAMLPATQNEMDSLKKTFLSSHINTTTFSGTNATEEAFKALDGKSTQILHLATHGFFLPVETVQKNNSLTAGDAFKTQQNPLLRSGLVLADGNRAWMGKLPTTNKEDGILTAYEIAQMDLSGTDLVVLSACGTALGDLKANEGVIGLQRAFKIAGVKQMVVSLWNVADGQTMELMNLFYSNWLGGQTTRKALRNAQLKIKEKYLSPYFWAAFVLVE